MMLHPPGSPRLPGHQLVISTAGQGTAQKASKRDVYNHWSSASTFVSTVGKPVSQELSPVMNPIDNDLLL